MLFLYLAILIAGIYMAYKLLAPEMKKPVPTRIAPAVDGRRAIQDDQPVNRIEKMEVLLAEKNKNILLLQTELKAFYAQIRDFDKVKTLLEEEVHRLKEQNRMFRSELGLPAVQPKENSIV
jgi:hypothetical protein